MCACTCMHAKSHHLCPTLRCLEISIGYTVCGVTKSQTRLSDFHFASLRCYASRQAPLCMGFSRQEYWSGLPSPPPGDRPGDRTWGLNPDLLRCRVGLESLPLSSLVRWQAGSLPLAPHGKHTHTHTHTHIPWS